MMGRHTCNTVQEYSHHIHENESDNASAELIGSIILIGLFVAAFGIVLVMLISTSSDFVVPAVAIDASITDDNTTYVLDIRAGDTLRKNDIRIIVDGRDDTANFTTAGGSDWEQWGLGESLYLDIGGSNPPESVQIVYDSNGGQILIWDVGTSVTVVPPTGLTPVAAFSANVTSGTVPLAVRFTETSSNDPYAWEWSFGDGGTSNSQNPVHIYQSTGVYTVQLTAFNHDGSGTVVKSAYIRVSENMGADFIGSPLSGNAPLTVNFMDLTTGTPTGWNWSFGDGTTSNETDPSHIYTNPGVYTVSLTVENTAVGSKTEVKTDYIMVTGLPLPVAWWRFDEASGNTALDSSGNGNDGTIEGGALDRRTGACGTGLYFDGTNTWVNVPNDATLSFSDTFTFAGWFKPEVPEYAGAPDTFRNYTQVIGKGYDDYQKKKYSNNYEVFLRVNDDRLRFEENGESDAANVEGATSDVDGLPLSYNDWFHLVVVVDGGTGTVYVDGQEEETFSVTRTPLQENTEPVSIGRQQVTKYDWANFFYKGMMDELYLYGTALTADEIATLADACTPPAGDPPVVFFTASPVTGDASLDVQFTSTVTGTAPLTYLWSFGDGSTSSDADPLHTYADAGTYDVNLTVTNAYGTDTLERTAYINATEGVSAFAQYVVNEDVFVYGQALSFAGDTVTGPGATIHITGSELNTDDLNLGSSLDVSNIYIDGSIDMNSGSAGLGSQISPGSIYVNGDFNLGGGYRVVYGDVYVNGDCLLQGVEMHGNVYIDGDLELDWTPDLNDAQVFYTGKFKHPKWMDSSIVNKCDEVESVPGFTIPAMTMASPKSDDWYSSHGYVTSGALADNIKICADSYTAINDWPAPSTTEDIIIVAKTGDITLTGMGNRIVTGVLFAPNGEVVFEGSSFEGLVIARDGFQVTSGGTTVTFTNMDQYISNPADYPF